MPALSQFVAQPPPHGRGCFVLVVDDNEINRGATLALLAQRTLQTAVARDGREAIDMAARDEWGAIFMDCAMPQVDGFEATRKIRAAEDGRHVPIVALTALTLPRDRRRCLEAGMDDYLSKPLLGPRLDAALEMWLPPDVPFLTSAGDDALDQAVVLQLGDALTPALRAELIQVFEEQQENCVVEIGAALKCGDRDGVRRAAHLLKGSSASLGAVKLLACCQELEHMGRSTDGDFTQEQLDRFRETAAQASMALRHRLLRGARSGSSGILPWSMKTTR